MNPANSAKKKTFQGDNVRLSSGEDDKSMPVIAHEEEMGARSMTN